MVQLRYKTLYEANFKTREWKHEFYIHTEFSTDIIIQSYMHTLLFRP